MEKTAIVAEIGLNHNGDLNIALELIKQAKWAKADFVKFQKRCVEKVYSKEYLDSSRESPWGHTQRDQKLGLEFGKKEYDVIDKFCRNVDIQWFASAWDIESVEFLKQYNLNYNKIASPMLTHLQLLEEVAKQKKYTFISTGMSTLDEIRVAVDIFKKHKCPVELMHCNSAYPMPIEEANLLMIPKLKEIFKCRVGYSGHFTGIIDAPYAVMLGATSIEKHLTLNRSDYGSDQSSSIEPMGFYRMVEYIRCAEKMLGDGNKVVTATEEKIKKKLRRSKDYE